MLQRRMDIAQLAVGREQDERAAPDAPGSLRDRVLDGAIEVLVLGQRKVGWQAHQGLVVEVER